MPARRDCLAVVGGFGGLAESMPHGTNRVGIDLPNALARSGRFRLLHAYHNLVSHPRVAASLSLPKVPDVSIEPRELAGLIASMTSYQAIYVAEGASFRRCPSTVRPPDDWAPLILQFGTVHNDVQWGSLLIAALTGTVRKTDVVVAKAERSAAVLADVWRRWNERFGVVVPRIATIANAVAVDELSRDEALGQALRRSLAIEPAAPVFLVFSRINPFNKGDLRGLVALWREVIKRNPRATLILSGAGDRRFVDELQTTARTLEVAHRVHVIQNPYEIWPNARKALMSAADAFLHLSTGAEETTSLVVLEAMAHQLAPVVSDWSDIGSLVDDGVEGFVIPTMSAALPSEVEMSLWGNETAFHMGLLSQSVAVDARRLVEAIVTLCDGDRARAMGARARARVAEKHGMQTVAAKHIALLDEAAAAAEAAWDGDVVPTTLVSSDAVLAIMAKTRLSPHDTVSFVDDAIIGRAPEFGSSESEDMATAVIATVRDSGSLTGTEICNRIAAQFGLGLQSTSDVWPYCARAILRLANYHAVEVTPVAPPP
jgi:glycosyltransferase involved in cell wall biosynthesis